METLPCKVLQRATKNRKLEARIFLVGGTVQLEHRVVFLITKKHLDVVDLTQVINHIPVGIVEALHQTIRL